MPTFEDLRAFQHALNLMVEVYTATEHFPKHEIYGLRSQLRRAACSVVSNIAEGQGRLTYGERRRLLSDARGSLYELQAQLIASTKLQFLAIASATYLRNQAERTARELDGLILWIRRKEAEAKQARNVSRKPNQ